MALGGELAETGEELSAGEAMMVGSDARRISAVSELAVSIGESVGSERGSYLLDVGIGKLCCGDAMTPSVVGRESKSGSA